MLAKLSGKLSWAILFVALGLILFYGGSSLIKTKVVEIIPTAAQMLPSQLEPSEGKTISLILVGDIMLNRRVGLMMMTHNDYRFPFLKIADDLKGAKLLFGNLEGPISDKGEKVGSIYSFRADPKTIEGLTFAGFDILSVANNHIFDYGRQALEDTFFRLKEVGIDYAGGGFDTEEAYSPIIREIKETGETKGTKIGFLAYTNSGAAGWQASQNYSGIAWADWNNLDKIKEDIKKAKSQVDVLIVSLHAGEEYSPTPNQFQIEFSRMAIDAGADLAVGHHPHVVQKNERYQNGWIFYSLGNFVFDQSFSEETMNGQILKVSIENGKIKEIIPINIKINQDFQPEIPG